MADPLPTPAQDGEAPGTHCLKQAVTTAMASEPALEAVKIDRERHVVSLATLGRPRDESFSVTLTDRIQRLDREPEPTRCALLTGAAVCDTCPGSRDAAGLPVEVRSEGHTTMIARVTCPTARGFWRWRELPLPRLKPREVTFSGEEDYEHEWRWQLAAAGVCGAAALAAWLLSGSGVSLPLYWVAYVAGAWFTVGEIRERLEEGVLDIHFLMLAVAVGSAAIGAWAEGATLLFLFSFSGALEHYAMGRTQREIRSLFRAAPKVATRLDEAGHEVPTPVEALQPGDRVLIRPGEQFPVDAEVRSGRTAADESTLTGEAVPVDKGVGDTVLSGTMNLWGSVEVGVLRPASESALQKVIRLIQDAQHLKAPAQRFTDKFSTGYTYAVLGLSTVMFFVWWLGFGLAPFVSAEKNPSAFYRAMTLLVVASPCALVLSIPSAVLAAIAWAARRGVLFRGGAAVEKLADVGVVAMDKTGTLTSGELDVERVESFPPGREPEVLRLACALERLSSHPLARAILKHGKREGLRLPETERFESVTGQGVRAWVEGRLISLGRREWLETLPSQPPLPEVAHAGLGHSEVWLAGEGCVGRILLRDELRPEAPGLVRQLRALGLQLVVLTGDRAEAAQQLKARVGIEDVRAGLSPDRKVAAIQEFAKDGRRVAMIGDGVNDAPSLAAADVGVAMGARGSDAALEQAEVVLMHDRLEHFLTAYQLSRRARRIIRQNLAISLGTVVVLVGCALTGGIPLTLGVLGHEGSTVVVVLNSLRLLLRRSH